MPGKENFTQDFKDLVADYDKLLGRLRPLVNRSITRSAYDQLIEEEDTIGNRLGDTWQDADSAGFLDEPEIAVARDRLTDQVREAQEILTRGIRIEGGRRRKTRARKTRRRRARKTRRSAF